MSICSVCFVLVVALVKVLEAVPLFDCTKLDTETDCKAVSFCFWNTTCPNSYGNSLDGNPNDNVACLPKCVTDPCLKLTTDADSCVPTGSPGYSCEKITTLTEHTCLISSNSTSSSYFCNLFDAFNPKPMVSSCFWNYYKTEMCNTVVDGVYCKLYDIGGGKTCEEVKWHEKISSGSCSFLSAEHCNYHPDCYISGASCSSGGSSTYYDPLTQSCLSDKDYVPYKILRVGSPPYLYTYTNKVPTPAIDAHAHWTYTSKIVNIFRQYYCYQKGRSPNTCYYLSGAIQQYPSYSLIANAWDQTELYWNYATCNQPRDACGWCPNLDFAFDDSPCTSQGCSVVTYNGERICVAPSSGTSLHRSPSFILTLLFVCVVFLFSN